MIAFSRKVFHSHFFSCMANGVRFGGSNFWRMNAILRSKVRISGRKTVFSLLFSLFFAIKSIENPLKYFLFPLLCLSELFKISKSAAAPQQPLFLCLLLKGFASTETCFASFSHPVLSLSSLILQPQ